MVSLFLVTELFNTGSSPCAMLTWQRCSVGKRRAIRCPQCGVANSIETKGS